MDPTKNEQTRSSRILPEAAEPCEGKVNAPVRYTLRASLPIEKSARSYSLSTMYNRYEWPSL